MLHAQCSEFVCRTLLFTFRFQSPFTSPCWGFLVCQCDSLPHSTLRDPLAGDPTGPHELGEFSLIQDVLPEVGCPILEGLVEDARVHVESWTNRTAGRDEPAQHIL